MDTERYREGFGLYRKPRGVGSKGEWKGIRLTKKPVRNSEGDVKKRKEKNIIRDHDQKDRSRSRLSCATWDKKGESNPWRGTARKKNRCRKSEMYAD